MKNNSHLSTPPAVIYEEEENIVKYRKTEDNLYEIDEDNFQVENLQMIIGKSKIVKKAYYKITKNKFVVISLTVMIVYYYIVVFESLMPMFDAHNILLEKKISQEKNTSVIHKSTTFWGFANKGFIYLFVFHFLISFFVVSFLLVACADPGSLHAEYFNLYSLRNYYTLYTTFFINKISTLNLQAAPVSSKLKDIEIYPNEQSNFKSKKTIENLIGTQSEQTEDDFSIIVDQENHGEYNKLNEKLKSFEKKVILKLRTDALYKPFWDLKCKNFQIRSLRENTCRYCMVIKPERVHHCRQCRACIRKMDHHCNFINNCVGLQTYKIFLNMLMYGWITSAFMSFSMIHSLKFIFEEYSFTLFTLIYLFLIVGQLTIASLLFYFWIYHIHIACTGLTQLEDTYKFDQRYDDYYVPLLRRFTMYEKFTSVFGRNPILWFLPIGLTRSYLDGYTYTNHV